MRAVLREIAGIEGAAAYRALNDADSSDIPASEMVAAGTLLRSAYEKHVNHAEKTGLPVAAQEVSGIALLGKGSRAEAYYDAAVTALLCSEIARLQGNRKMARVWVNRAVENAAKFEEAGEMTVAVKGLSRTIGAIPIVGTIYLMTSTGRRDIERLARAFYCRVDNLSQACELAARE